MNTAQRTIYFLSIRAGSTVLTWYLLNLKKLEHMAEFAYLLRDGAGMEVILGQIKDFDHDENSIKMSDKTGKPIPINWAKKIAEDLGYSQVIIHGYDENTGIQHVTTFGKSLADCDNAAKGGNVVKKLLGFSEEACQSVPARIKRKYSKG